MSLLTSVNSGSPNLSYFIENIGGNGAASNALPCIKGTQFGAIKVGDSATGLVIRGDPAGTGLGFVRGGLAAGSSVTLGSSSASQSNVVLTDGVVTMNGDVVVAGAGSDLSVGGDIVLANGDAAGKSISGYYNEVTASASYADVSDTPIANPPGLTAGWYIVAAATATGGQQEEQVSVIVHRSAGGLWDIGGTIRSVAGGGTFGFKPSANRTTMVVQNSTGAAQTATIYWAKLLN